MLLCFNINHHKEASLTEYVKWGLPDGPVVKTLPSKLGGAGSIPGQEAKIPRALQSKKKKKNIKQKQYCNKFNNDFKNDTH